MNEKCTQLFAQYFFAKYVTTLTYILRNKESNLHDKAKKREM